MTKHTTIVFEYDIRAFSGNPFAAETPFGTPFGITDGDLQESAALTQRLGDALAQLVAVIDAAGMKNLSHGVSSAMARANAALDDFVGEDEETVE